MFNFSSWKTLSETILNQPSIELHSSSKGELWFEASLSCSGHVDWLISFFFSFNLSALVGQQHQWTSQLPELSGVPQESVSGCCRTSTLLCLVALGSHLVVSSSQTLLHPPPPLESDCRLFLQASGLRRNWEITEVLQRFLSPSGWLDPANRNYPAKDAGKPARKQQSPGLTAESTEGIPRNPCTEVLSAFGWPWALSSSLLLEERAITWTTIGNNNVYEDSTPQTCLRLLLFPGSHFWRHRKWTVCWGSFHIPHLPGFIGWV